MGVASEHPLSARAARPARGAGTPLSHNTTGNDNTALGFAAGSRANPNTTGSNNTFLGANASTSNPLPLNNATAIGANALVGANDALVLAGTWANAVNVGIGTTTPGSTLQVVGGYVQLPTVTGFPPLAADCNQAAEAGRMVVRTDGAVNLYICRGVAGWIGK